jgi:hypothetical protein
VLSVRPSAFTRKVRCSFGMRALGDILELDSECGITICADATLSRPPSDRTLLPCLNQDVSPCCLRTSGYPIWLRDVETQTVANDPRACPSQSSPRGPRPRRHVSRDWTGTVTSFENRSDALIERLEEPIQEGHEYLRQCLCLHLPSFAVRDWNVTSGESQTG